MLNAYYRFKIVFRLKNDMRLLEPFDYIYYRVALFYEDNFSNKDRWNALFILSIMQSANLLTIVNVVFIFRDVEVELSPFVLLLLVTLFCFGFNLIRYNKVRNIKDLKILWSTENKANKTQKGFYVIIYFIFSIVLIIFTTNAIIKK